MNVVHERAATHGAAESARTSRTMVLAAALGNGLEFFDFTVYSFFSALIGQLFFPSHDAMSSLMMSLATFGVGFVVRPLGGVTIGAYADRAGRKPALILTVLLMALGTGLIGLAPTYAQIGLAAPALIVLGRLLQGFSAGGEVGAATTLLMEAGREGRRGLLVSWQMASQGGAALAGALIALLLSKSLSHEQLITWGWRVPFLIGLAIGPLGFFLRARLDDTLPAHAHAHATPKTSAVRRKLPLRVIVAGTMLVIGGTGTMYTIVFFLPAFLALTLHMPAATASASGCAAGLVLLIGSPFAGKLADRLPRRKPLLAIVSVVSLALLFPAFAAIAARPTVSTVLIVAIVLIGLMTLTSPAGFLMILEALRPEVRATSLGIIYAVGVTLFGGFAQLAVGALWRATGSFYAPAWYVLGCGIVSLAGLTLFREKASG
ncbi:MFS family permease [Paraburkholderia bannensis]|uniref:MFS family permease n=1 Tax=Paraburkholderia bannensis TaxID=765414 RepID=A0A7W9WT11_9BURK|nr:MULTISPECIES: MFS transporter [Paraburkholderia]MBB3258066.1 MFS family permease [Paraburkholderia sp. WP4_3_2]MBB6103079.1 MFS family permease [Paraburkholderia bannensis]